MSVPIAHLPTNDRTWDEVVQVWEALSVPAGWKAEVIEGEIVMSPSPSGRHNVVAGQIARQLYQVLPESHGLYQTLDLAVPARNGIFIPDLVVVPEATLLAQDEGHVLAGEAELVVEITSPSSIGRDRITKRDGYATAGVPLYLLVDAFGEDGPEVTLFGEPSGGIYRVLFTGTYGDAVSLPEPFDIALKTSGFPRPRKRAAGQ